MSRLRKHNFIVLVIFYAICSINGYENPVPNPNPSSECYNSRGEARRCIPEFENAAYNKRIEATNTCGENGDIDFCIQTGYSNRKSCDVCRLGDFPTDKLTDVHDAKNPTWWQSETIFEGIQHPTTVNLTLHLGKSFDITYIRLVFYSPRPESFAIYKRVSQDSPWVPYQYYSATCRSTYGLPDSLSIQRGENESRALCTSEYSDISPLQFGNIAFSSLEGRPSAYNFENSMELQSWVTATDIMISLTRLNTFGDEVFGDPQVLKSYFYAIADIAVGARCKCNGHANRCVQSTGLNSENMKVCECKHNTDGPDCERCKPFYNDAPWGRATSKNANECKPCNCNGFSKKCYFDRNLYNLTGHGGHCIDCEYNRDGVNCERCKENYYMREDGYCINCGCNPTGSRSLQCNSEGKCQCKPGVTGEKCDRCEANHYNFGNHGCAPCNCDPRGSADNTPSCDPNTGICYCKENVEGRHCRECKPGFFNLDIDNRFGCTPCFCYGHTAECASATGYSVVSTTSNFNKHKEKWIAIDDRNTPIDLKYSQPRQSIGVINPGSDAVYFSAPDRFLGDQRASYNRLLKFKLQLLKQRGPNPTPNDIILEGAGTQISLPIFAQQQGMPNEEIREFAFRLHEHPDYSWQPSQSSRGFMSILSNLTAIKIRATYSDIGEAYIDDVELQTAHRGAAGYPATWIEQCVCPEGFLGQFCESCAPGYRHNVANGGPFMRCIPCDCNKHAEICDSETGRCICQHNTAGDTCDQCARGYYGNALGGTPYDCKRCPCPDNGPCMSLNDGTVICLDCPTGYFGPRCELCSDGYFGDPTGAHGKVQLCQLCDCNGNIDPNAVGNCNRTTGECLKCIHNTAGPHCDKCLPGHFGDPFAAPHGNCERCNCYPRGTQQTEDAVPICDQISGNCHCKANVVGKSCNECQPGFWNIVSGEGCESCNCDPVGSFNSSCDTYTGQCFCKPGVTGQRCDKCDAYQYGFSEEGCKPCDCDISGSKSSQCDEFGQCPCNENVEGRRCNRCKENKYDRHQGCLDCPACYNLVQDAANEHRTKLSEFNKILTEIAENPTVIEDKEFEAKLNVLHEKINILLEDAKSGTGGGEKSLIQKLDDMKLHLSKIEETIQESNKLQTDGKQDVDQADENLQDAQKIIQEASKELANALDLLHSEGVTELARARNKSNQFDHQSVQMSDISRTARGLAEDLEKQARDERDQAAEAKEKSETASELAKKTVELQREISENLKVNVAPETVQLSKKLDGLKKMTTEALDKSSTTYDESLTLLSNVKSIATPEINVVPIITDSGKLINDTQLVNEELERLFDKNTQLLNDLEDNMKFASLLLERGKVQKSDAMEMLDQVNKARETAEKAVDEGDATLSKANETLQTLQSFQSQVTESSQKAQAALEKVPDIRQQIVNTEDIINVAEEALDNAHQNAKEARKNAQEAQEKYADQASKEADSIRRRANEAKTEAEKLHSEADQLNSRVAATEHRIENLEEVAGRDDQLTEAAKEKVGQAKSDSEKAQKQLEKAMDEVKMIMNELENMKEISIADLDLLDERLNRTEAELDKAKLNDRIQTLHDLKNHQNRWIKQYQTEIVTLEKEVANIKSIANALPTGCFKRTRLEP